MRRAKKRPANRQPNRQLPGAVREIVNQLAGQQGAFNVGDVTSVTGTSRQAVHRQLARLVQAGTLIRQGKGRATRYLLGAPGPVAEAPPPARPARFDRRYPRDGLAEDRVWDELAAALPILATARAANGRALMAYALTEMVNNAIDHSGAPEVRVRAGGDVDRLWFEVDDAGVGAFENVRAALALPDVLAGLQEISKGKRTTMPARHSGEGIFFTAKMADFFALVANGLIWQVDNLRSDQAIGSASAKPGTQIHFEVAPAKPETPEQIFARYTHDFEFDTSHTVVKLFAHGVRFVSRSEAKRLLAGLERFRRVIIDFAGVESVGQGFADEIFRVWANDHPAVELQTENMSPPVAFMVGRARPPAAR